MNDRSNRHGEVEKRSSATTDRTPESPESMEALWRAVIAELPLDQQNPAARDPRFRQWVAEHASAPAEAALTDEEWLARGQALRDAARRFLEQSLVEPSAE